MGVEEYLKGLRANNRFILSKAITLIESTLPIDRKKSLQLIEKCVPFKQKSIRLGVSGTPGVGKSTFIEALTVELLKENHKIAILTIDPTSTISKGSILGDKTRMSKLTKENSVFIRPSPSKGELGGVCNTTKETINLCETAGYDIIIIETVGVGQSEILVESMTDFFLYLTLVENGDELQFIKKGGLEISDVIILNKIDLNTKKAKVVQSLLENHLKLSNHMKEQKVFGCSAKINLNIKKVWAYIKKKHHINDKKGLIKSKRKLQNFFWLNKIVEEEYMIEKRKEIQKIMFNYKNSPLTNPRKIACDIITKLK